MSWQGDANALNRLFVKLSSRTGRASRTGGAGGAGGAGRLRSRQHFCAPVLIVAGSQREDAPLQHGFEIKNG